MTRLLLVMLCLSGCDAASSDYPVVGEARTSAAEWAKINDLVGRREVTETYARHMRTSAHDELAKAHLALTDAAAKGEVAALLALPPDASPERIQPHVDRLKQAEDRLAVS